MYLTMFNKYNKENTIAVKTFYKYQSSLFYNIITTARNTTNRKKGSKLN